MEERRRVPRHAFGGVVELSAVTPNIYIIAKTTEISRNGCFIRAREQVIAGTKVNLKISYDGGEFNSFGEVVYALSGKGMGIRFDSPTDEDSALLDEWLKQTTV
jgi:PilZ domain